MEEEIAYLILQGIGSQLRVLKKEGEKFNFQPVQVDRESIHFGDPSFDQLSQFLGVELSIVGKILPKIEIFPLNQFLGCGPFFLGERKEGETMDEIRVSFKTSFHQKDEFFCSAFSDFSEHFYCKGRSCFHQFEDKLDLIMRFNFLQGKGTKPASVRNLVCCSKVDNFLHRNESHVHFRHLR